MKHNVILITGAAGFIGSNLVKKLLQATEGVTIVGVDNLSNYYDVSIKEYRLKEIEKISTNSGSTWIFVKGNIADRGLICKIFAQYRFDIVYPAICCL